MKSFYEWMMEKKLLQEMVWVCDKCNIVYDTSHLGASEPKQMRCRNCGKEMRKRERKAA